MQNQILECGYNNIGIIPQFIVFIKQFKELNCDLLVSHTYYSVTKGFENMIHRRFASH